MRLLILLLLLLPGLAHAQPGLDLLTVIDNQDGGQTYTLSIKIFFLMTVLTLLPAAVLMMTSFTRIIIVLAILRQALGTAQTPSSQILIGLALFLSFFIMTPVIDQIYQGSIQPYMDEQMTADQAINNAAVPIREFMLAQTRETDIELFANISGKTDIATQDDIPFTLIVPAFVTSELKTAFQIGFLIFIPFLIIDLVVASVLMSMGMMMLSPLIISFPFKLMLFVLVDGWALIMGTLAGSFYFA
ncbi:MAG: flagellar type III secretion system pore protein FliP [Gammaproteobacteria bacterium]